VEREGSDISALVARCPDSLVPVPKCLLDILSPVTGLKGHISERQLINSSVP